MALKIVQFDPTIYVITKMLMDSKVRFDLPMTDTLLSRSLNQSYGSIPAKNLNVCHRDICVHFW